MDFITNLLSLIWTTNVLWLVVGLLVGWNVLPQPGWVKNVVERVFPKK